MIPELKKQEIVLNPGIRINMSVKVIYMKLLQLFKSYFFSEFDEFRLENLSEDEEFNELAREILIHKENKNSVDDWSIEIDPRVEKGVKIFEIKYVVGQDEAKESCWFKSEEMASKVRSI